MDYYQEKALELLKDIPEGPRFSWEFRQRALAKKIINGDLPNLLRWPIVREALHAGYSKHAVIERSMLPRKVLRITKDPSAGNSNAVLSTESASGTFIRQALASHTIDSEFIPLPSISSILEFGGGYGASAVVLRRMGYRGVHYVYDFPILHLIREWYLSQDLGSNYFFTVPLVEIPEGFNADVFISICAIDESPIDFRNEFMKRFEAIFYLFVVTSQYQGMMNATWCKNWFNDNDISYKATTLVNGNQTMFVGERR